MTPSQLKIFSSWSGSWSGSISSSLPLLVTDSRTCCKLVILGLSQVLSKRERFGESVVDGPVLSANFGLKKIRKKYFAEIGKNSKNTSLDLNRSASGCYVLVTPDLNTWFSLTSSRLFLLNFVINSLNFLLFQNIYLLFWNFDQTKYEWIILVARFERARFEI